MKLSRKGEYALRAMIVLARHYGEGFLQIREIAERENIPRKFLEQILLELNRAGLLEGRRGPGGGYRLIKAPAEVTLAQIVRIIDGPLAPLSCVSKTAHVKCPDQRKCGLYGVMHDVRDAIAEILEGVSLADICPKGKARAKAETTR